MTIKNVVFPEHLSTGTRLGPGFRTTIVQTASGAEYRNSSRSKPVHRYDVRKAVQTAADVAELRNFFNIVRGAAYGFRFWDHLDHSTAADHTGAPDDEDAPIGTGDGSTTQFQLQKVYSYGGETMFRTITQPKADTTVVAVAGVAQTAGTNFSVDTATGIVTFTSAPTNGAAITAGCEFYVPCRFGQETDRWLSINADQNINALQSIIVQEIPDGLPVVEIGDTGGASVPFRQLNAAETLSLYDGRCQIVGNTTGSTVDLVLPLIESVPFGGPIFMVYSSPSSTNDVRIYDSENAQGVVTIGAGNAAQIYVGADSNSNKIWIGAL